MIGNMILILYGYTLYWYWYWLIPVHMLCEVRYILGFLCIHDLSCSPSPQAFHHGVVVLSGNMIPKVLTLYRYMYCRYWYWCIIPVHMMCEVRYILGFGGIHDLSCSPSPQAFHHCVVRTH